MNHLVISVKASLKEAIEHLNQNGIGFVCVKDDSDLVVGTITDGDIRRAILKGNELTVPCEKIMNKAPITVSAGFSKAEIKKLFKEKKIRNVPVLSDRGHLIDVVSLGDFLAEPEEAPEKVAVIMAGGEGKRLRPFTENTPKPMLEVDGKPILEHIVLKLKDFGFKKFYISVNYLSEVIMDYFKDGEVWDVEISYLEEPKKLGTAGALSLLPNHLEGPILMLNGDVFSDVNFQQFFDAHLESQADFSMAASTFKIEIPFGVLKLEKEKIVGVEEKPTKSYLCNAGIYMLSKQAIKLVPSDEKYDMTELLNLSLSQGLKANVFPLHECWLDVGRKEDLLKARTEEHK